MQFALPATYDFELGEYYVRVCGIYDEI